VTGNPQLGYDVGSITSLALVGVAGPRASVSGSANRNAMQLQLVDPADILHMFMPAVSTRAAARGDMCG
jgi:hypothetical protein